MHLREVQMCLSLKMKKSQTKTTTKSGNQTFYLFLIEAAPHMKQHAQAWMLVTKLATFTGYCIESEIHSTNLNQLWHVTCPSKVPGTKNVPLDNPINTCQDSTCTILHLSMPNALLAEIKYCRSNQTVQSPHLLKWSLLLPKGQRWWCQNTNLNFPIICF